MDVNIIWLVVALCIAGAAAGFTSGLFGNGGGFVVVPALTAVFPLFVVESQELVKVAIGTSLASIVISSARALVAHNKKGAVDFKLLKSWSAWIVLGALGGILIANNSDSSMLTVIFAGGVLFYSVYFCFLRWWCVKEHHTPCLKVCLKHLLHLCWEAFLPYLALEVGRQW